MGKIIGISGRKQSGKNTFANYVNGSILKSKGMVEDFYIDNDGKLAIKTVNTLGKSGYGILDIGRKDLLFLEYAESELWPYVKVYSFADYLKEVCINLFDFTPQQVYGNDEEKNSIVDIKWETMPYSRKKGNMTSREFMQQFGTSIIRRLKDDAFVSNTIKRIIAEDSEVSLIADVRFPNEFEAIKKSGGIVVRLTRDVFSDNHKCESALDKENFDWDNFDLVIDNNNMSIQEFCQTISYNKHIWETL